MPGVGSSYRLKDGSLAVDNKYFTDLFKYIQLCYKIESDLGKDAADPHFTWTDFFKTNYDPSPDHVKRNNAPSNIVVEEWLKNIHYNLVNLCKLMVDENHANIYRFTIWFLLRWHLTKASYLRGGTSGYTMMNWSTFNHNWTGWWGGDSEEEVSPHTVGSDVTDHFGNLLDLTSDLHINHTNIGPIDHIVKSIDSQSNQGSLLAYMQTYNSFYCKCP